MKFNNYLETISGIGIYPVITLLIFFIFFSTLGLWLLKSRKEQFNRIHHLPLEITETNEQHLSEPKP